MKQNIVTKNKYSFEPFLYDFFKSDGYDIEPIIGDASNRVYFRILNNNSKNFILMDSSKEIESLEKFIKIDELLVVNGFKAPQIYSKDVEKGLLLIEDLGAKPLAKQITLENERGLYQKTIDCLIDIQQKIEINNSDIEKYSEDILYNESKLFIDWYLPNIKNKTPEQISEIEFKYQEIIQGLISSIDVSNKCLVLRDFHAENIIINFNENHSKITSDDIGLIDFQDALVGHGAYDLVSLLEDARRDVSYEIQQDMLSYYMKILNLDSSEIEVFKNDYYILGAQRNLKILGIFARLAYRDGQIYLEF